MSLGIRSLCNFQDESNFDSEPAEFKFESVTSSLPTPEKLAWDLNSEIVRGLEQAHKNITDVINDSDMKILHFNDYGSDMIKLGILINSDCRSDLL